MAQLMWSLQNDRTKVIVKSIPKMPLLMPGWCRPRETAECGLFHRVQETRPSTHELRLEAQQRVGFSCSSEIKQTKPCASVSPGQMTSVTVRPVFPWTWPGFLDVRSRSEQSLTGNTGHLKGQANQGGVFALRIERQVAYKNLNLLELMFL